VAHRALPSRGSHTHAAPAADAVAAAATHRAGVPELPQPPLAERTGPLAVLPGETLCASPAQLLELIFHPPEMQVEGTCSTYFSKENIPVSNLFSVYLQTSFLYKLNLYNWFLLTLFVVSLMMIYWKVVQPLISEKLLMNMVEKKEEDSPYPVLLNSTQLFVSLKNIQDSFSLQILKRT